MSESTPLLFFSKFLPMLVLPLGITMLGGALALVTMRRYPGIARVVLVAGLVQLWVASTPAFSRWIIGTLEDDYPAVPVAAFQPTELIYLLGGAVSATATGNGAPDLGEANDRILFAQSLLKAGKAKRIIVTGGAMPWSRDGVAEADVVKDVLLSMGVPEAAIATAGVSRNTREDAQAVLSVPGVDPQMPALLVTSAFHMPRAMAVFRAAGLNVIAAPADIRANRDRGAALLDVLPESKALETSTLALREWMGLIVYRVRRVADERLTI